MESILVGTLVRFVNQSIWKARLPCVKCEPEEIGLVTKVLPGNSMDPKTNYIVVWRDHPGYRYGYHGDELKVVNETG